MKDTALALRPGEDVEARTFFAEGVALLECAEARVIKTVEDVKSVNDDLSAIARLKKVMEGKRKALLDPLKADMDAIRDTYTYLMTPVIQAKNIYGEKMLAYVAEQDRIRKAQEEINRKRMEAAEEEMKLKGELSESVDLVEVAPEAPKTVRTEMGTSGVTSHWTYEVVDFAKVPDAYKMIDASQLSAIAKKHHDKKEVPGVRFFDKPSITTRAR